ncbi:MAG: putative baseplate assembly protein, partial [Anaerolineae bacterium]
EIFAAGGEAVAWSGGAGDAPLFITADGVTLQDGKETVAVVAYHCEWVVGERAYLRTGKAGPTVQLSRRPVIANTGTELDLKVRVEVGQDELGDGGETPEGKKYRVWREVTGFMDYEADECVYVADRYSGQITFPSKSPPKGREIRISYAHGGGPAGNVRAGALTLLRDPIPGIGAVTNPDAASGGRAAETLEDMRLYGPQGIHCQERAVTARDFETLARRASGEVARARALAQAELWKHGQPGTVEVLLAPDVPAKEWGPEGQVTSADIGAKRIPDIRTQVQDYLDTRRPMGVRCEVKWAQLKTVSVSATVLVWPKEVPSTVERRVRERLYQYINPLPTMTSGSGARAAQRLSGWPFGRSLHVSSVHAEVLAVEGVRRVDELTLTVENMPDGHVTALTPDHLTGTWYAASGNRFFRSQNDGDGWELLRWFAEDESIELVRAHPGQAGLIAAVATKGKDDKQVFRAYVSRDCGEEWRLEKGIDSVGEVHDIDWTTNKDGAPVLLLAAANGLYALAVNDGSRPQRVDVDPETDDLGFYAVAVAHDEARDRVSVAVAARNEGGVFLCLDWIRDCHFEP